jgi:hypothetical protein
MLKFIHLIAEHQPDFSDEETPRWDSHPEIGFRRGEITELRRRMAKDIREMAQHLRDSKDLLKSNKIRPPVTVMDDPCGFRAHMEASVP